MKKYLLAVFTCMMLCQVTNAESLIYDVTPGDTTGKKTPIKPPPPPVVVIQHHGGPSFHEKNEKKLNPATQLQNPATQVQKPATQVQKPAQTKASQ